MKVFDDGKVRFGLTHNFEVHRQGCLYYWEQDQVDAEIENGSTGMISNRFSLLPSRPISLIKEMLL